MKKNMKVLIICCFFIFSFNILSEIILNNENTTFSEFTQEIEKNIKEGRMTYIENQQCFISNYKMFYKNSKLDHLNIYATCIDTYPNRKIEWDNPKIPKGTEKKTIHIMGKNTSQRMLDEMKKGKNAFLIKKLYYYKSSDKNYKKGEYYYFD